MSSVSLVPIPKLISATFSSDITTMLLPLSHHRPLCAKTKRDIACSTRHSLLVSSLISSPSLAHANVVDLCSSTLAAGSWREIHGASDWEGLVEPLDPLLRHEIVRYGEFVAAAYKAFDLDRSSERYLRCKYGEMNMLKEVGLGASGYNATKYIYAAPDINIPIQNETNRCGRWIGYVAVSSNEEVERLGRRDVIIAFRGTITSQEWIANLMSSLTPARLDPHNHRPDVMVEEGLLNLYTSDKFSTMNNKKFGIGSCREQLLSEVSRLLNKYKGEEMSITLAGHSLGSSLSLLLAYDIAELGLNRINNNVPVTVFSFAGPRAGNSAFKQRCDELGVKVLRVVNVNDPITKLPGIIFNEGFRVQFRGGKYEFPLSYSCYAHVGVEIAIDFFKMHNPSCIHDLETYINLLRYPNDLEIGREEKDFVERVKDSLLGAQNFNMFPWIIAACSMVNLLQSQCIYC